jgi:hypothetical protein
MASAQTRALEAAKQAAADERTAWRAAITERLKHQAAEREDKHRAELLKQRDEQLEVCVPSTCHMRQAGGQPDGEHAHMRCSG